MNKKLYTCDFTPFEEEHVQNRIALAVARYRKALYRAAPSHQGGHGEAGKAIADVLGLTFPIRMTELLSKARDEKMDPRDLWPWMYTLPSQERA